MLLWIARQEGIEDFGKKIESMKAGYVQVRMGLFLKDLELYCHNHESSLFEEQGFDLAMAREIEKKIFNILYFDFPELVAKRCVFAVFDDLKSEFRFYAKSKDSRNKKAGIIKLKKAFSPLFDDFIKNVRVIKKTNKKALNKELISALNLFLSIR